MRIKNVRVFYLNTIQNAQPYICFSQYPILLSQFLYLLINPSSRVFHSIDCPKWNLLQRILVSGNLSINDLMSPLIMHDLVMHLQLLLCFPLWPNPNLLKITQRFPLVVFISRQTQRERQKDSNCVRPRHSNSSTIDADITFQKFNHWCGIYMKQVRNLHTPKSDICGNFIYPFFSFD